VVSFLLLTTLNSWLLVLMDRRHLQHTGSHAQYYVYLGLLTKYNTSLECHPCVPLVPLVLRAFLTKA
jgi:hypothetical protein